MRRRESQHVFAGSPATQGFEAVAQRDPVRHLFGQGRDDLMVAAADLEPLVALPVDREPLRRVGADRLDEVQGRLVREVQAELVDVRGFEDVIEPVDVQVTPEVIPERRPVEAGVEGACGCRR